MQTINRDRRLSFTRIDSLHVTLISLSFPLVGGELRGSSNDYTIRNELCVWKVKTLASLFDVLDPVWVLGFFHTPSVGHSAWRHYHDLNSSM